MADLLNLYRSNADRAQADADSATLENVRDRNLRAAAAWTGMAERVERTERARAARESAVVKMPHASPVPAE
jgi:hypothetical protein